MRALTSDCSLHLLILVQQIKHSCIIALQLPTMERLQEKPFGVVVYFTLGDLDVSRMSVMFSPV